MAVINTQNKYEKHKLNTYKQTATKKQKQNILTVFHEIQFWSIN